METKNKNKKKAIMLAVIGIAIVCICVIGVFAKKAYDRHQEELRLQAIETKNSEIDGEYQRFEKEEDRNKKLEALKQEMESAEKYKKTEGDYEECSAHYEKIIAQMKNSFVSEYDDTIKIIADKIGDDVEKVDDKEALKNATSEFTTFKDILKNDFENYNTVEQDSFDKYNSTIDDYVTKYNDRVTTIEKTRYLLTDAIQRQLVSDVPLCFFLSGGLDSSIIVKTASMYNKEHKLGKINTYSVEYRDNEKYFQKSNFQPTPDYEFISMMSKNADTKHREIVLDNTLVCDALYESVQARDLPGYVDVDSSLLLFCKEIKQNYTVALSGECADELFGGYPWYHNHEILFEDCFPWSKSQDIRRSILKDGVLKNGEEYVRQRYLDTISLAPKLKSDTDLDRRMREMFYLNFYWFMQCLLERKDRCSMFSGLEVRVPFCDYRLVEYAYNMPWELKAWGNREKGIVRKAFEDILPEEICWRKKSPYPKTHNPIYFNECVKRVRKILKKRSILNELLDRKGIEDIIENPDKITNPWYGQLMKAPQILAYIIELDYWFDKYNVEIV